MRIVDLPPQPRRSTRSRRRNRRRDASSIVSSSTPLPIEPSQGMILDSNGNDIGQALASKVRKSEIRVKDNKARARAARRSGSVKSSGDSWISEAFSDLTGEISLTRNISCVSDISNNTQGTARLVKETYIKDADEFRLQQRAAAVRKKGTYMPSKYMPNGGIDKQTNDDRGAGLMGLFSNFACADSHYDDDASEYTEHRDERGTVRYEV